MNNSMNNSTNTENSGPSDASPNGEPPSGMQLHMGIAEQGKIYALAGDHIRALNYYRVAMRLTVEAGDPEIFFRHYLECGIASVGHLRSIDQETGYCEQTVNL